MKGGKNPIFAKHGQSVANDVYLSYGHNFNIITGVNMVLGYFTFVFIFLRAEKQHISKQWLFYK